MGIDQKPRLPCIEKKVLAANSEGKQFPGFSFSLLSLQIPDKNEFYNNGKWLPEMVRVDLAGPPPRIMSALWDVF